MPKPRVYVETTIPSAYFTSRVDAGMVRKHLETRQWWERAVTACELVTSVAVQQEVMDGQSHHVARRLALLGPLRVLDVGMEELVTAATYIRQKLMPASLLGDALHLALASHHECDVLVTWNYRHLANRTKLKRIERLNVQLGLFVPRILRPIDMLESDLWESGR